MAMLSIAPVAAERKTYLNLFSSKMRGVPQSISTSILFSSSAAGATARQSPELI